MSLARIEFSRNTRIELGCGYKAAKKFVFQEHDNQLELFWQDLRVTHKDSKDLFPGTHVARSKRISSGVLNRVEGSASVRKHYGKR